MKNMKKLCSVLLALVMVLTMAVGAFAEGEATKNNSITINNAKVGETYKLYKLFDLTVNDEANPTAYTYTVNAAWKDFFAQDGNGKNYVTINEAGAVTAISDAAALAKAAAEWASKPKDPKTVTVLEGESTAVFSDLENGYWLVTSTLGTIAMTETTPDKNVVTITEKNPDNSQKKEVQEDSNHNWGKSNTAQIGDTVEFRVTITLKKGTRNVAMHDQMDDGLTFNKNSVEIKGLTKGTDYTVVTEEGELTDGCTFEIKFIQSYLDKLTGNTEVVVTYNAVLNEMAEVTTGEKNKSQITWGDNSKTVWDETTTTTLTFDIVKTDSSKKVLDGAKFKLYDAETGGKEIPVVKVNDGVYRVAVKGETGVEIETDDGKATVQGLDANTTYWLEETAAPAGYNKLDARVKVAIEGDNLSTTMSGDTWVEGNGGVQITNNTGAELPSTGGMGTTLLYVVGGVLFVGAAVLLITKRRMNKD